MLMVLNHSVGVTLGLLNESFLSFNVNDKQLCLRFFSCLK